MVYPERQWNYPEFTEASRLTAGMFLIIGEIFGIIGNLFVLIIVLRILRNRKNIPNILIFILSIVDLISLPLIYSQIMITYIFGRYVGEQVACDYHATIIIICKYTSLVLISMISLDRFLAMSFPFLYKEKISYDEHKKHIIAIFFIVIIILTIAHSILPLVGIGRNVLHYPNSYCLFDMDRNKKDSIILLSMHLVFLASLMMLIIITNIGVCIQSQLLIKKIRPSIQLSKRVAKAQSIEKVKGTSERYKKITPKQEKKLLRISLFSIGIFVICWLPFLIRLILAVGGVPFSAGLDFTSAALASCHSAISPWIYPLFRKQYSSGFWHMFRFCLSKLSFNLIKKPESTLNDIVDAKSNRKETLLFYSRQRAQTKTDTTQATDEIELDSSCKQKDVSKHEMNEQTPETTIDEQNANTTDFATENRG